jgi:outer membrane protein assembly factor BamB
VLALMMAGTPVRSSDQPQWGERWTRNQVSGERHLPSAFNPKTGENLRWKVRLGSETHSTPIIADGRVYIGTNNGEPRDPRHTGDRGVLMCFDERDGHLLWQLVVPKREEDPFLDWPKSGIASPVTVEGNRVYVVSNRGEVLCLDPRGLENGNDGPFQEEGRHMTPKAEPALAPGPTDADILWATDLTAVAGIWSHDAAHSSILILGDHLYVNTGTGVDNTHKKIRTPDAPSLVVLDKRTGRLLARDQEHIAPLIFHCTWSSPSSARVGGRTMVFFAGGDGVLYGFEPYSGSSTPDTVAALKAVWRFDLDPAGPKQNVHRYNSNRRESPSNVYGMPVFDHGRLYVAGGGDLWWGKNEAWIKCLDVSHASDKSPPSLVWSSPLEKHVLSTPAVYRGMVFIADCGRNVKCLEAATGRVLWSHETNGEIWGSPMVADGKVYIGTRRGDFWVFEAGREKKILSTVELGSPISGTVTAANGVLYVATMTDLYAIASPR